MMTRKNIHLWLIGAASFVAVAYLEIKEARANAEVIASISGPAHAIQPPAAAGPSDPSNGEALYRGRCGACHSIETNRVGPRHRGVFGRQAGSLADFDYSKALRESDLIWTKSTLDVWLNNPEALIAGQKMGYRLSDPNEREQIIEYLILQTDQ